MRFALFAGTITLGLITHGSPGIAATSDELADRFSEDIQSTLTENTASDLTVLTQFYAERDMRPVWVGEEAPTARAETLLRILKNSAYDGLNPEDYDVSTIQALMQSAEAGELAELDLRLSLGLMQFLSDLGSGRTEPNALDPELFVYPQDIDKAETIRKAAEAEDIGVFVGGYRPKQVDYWRLKGALASYRAVARVGGWPTIDEGGTLRPGDRSPRVAQLRARLERERGLEVVDGVGRDLFDPALAEAVERFQKRHGLEQDGRVGPKTLQALNTPVEERIEQIVLNLERRRWMPDRHASRYVYVNLADFHLQLIDDGKVTFDTPVVIGSEYNKTPVFSADMTYMVINPYWNVPPSIAKNEILPKTKADPGYLKKNNFDLFRSWHADAELLDPLAINWQRVEPDNFGYKVRQRPGPSNALGRLKFMLPNEYNIYLHDTPARADFAANQRSFSHGCVRVADPEALAHAILGDQSGWTPDGIADAVESGKRNVVNLDEPLPVQITYLTAWVDDENQVHFRNDVYDRDQILADALIDNPQRRNLFAEDGLSTEAHLDDVELELEGATTAQ